MMDFEALDMSGDGRIAHSRGGGRTTAEAVLAAQLVLDLEGEDVLQGRPPRPGIPLVAHHLAALDAAHPTHNSPVSDTQEGGCNGAKDDTAGAGNP